MTWSRDSRNGERASCCRARLVATVGLLLLMVSIQSGCQQQGAPLSNPFLAPSRVPPPGTRSPEPGTAVPYYGGAPTPAGSPTGYLSPNVPELGDLPPASAEQIRNAQLDSGSTTAHMPPSGDTFRRPGRPDADRGRVETVAYEAPIEIESAAADPPQVRRIADGPKSFSRYGYADNYSWIQGRLEHSEAKDQWKVRYIPIDGETDEFGGSVVLANPQALGDLAAGDFVRIRGALAGEDRDALSYARRYRIGEIRPLAD